MSDEEDNRVRPVDAVTSILAEGPLLKYLGLKNTNAAGWELFQKLVVEAVLQHYGVTTSSSSSIAFFLMFPVPH